MDLQKSYPAIHIVQLDVTNDECIEKAYRAIVDILGDEPLNTIINNAGIAERVKC